MTKKLISLICILIVYFPVIGQNEPANNSAIIELNTKLEELIKLYNTLKNQLDLTQTNVENTTTS